MQCEQSDDKVQFKIFAKARYRTTSKKVSLWQQSTEIIIRKVKGWIIYSIVCNVILPAFLLGKLKTIYWGKQYRYFSFYTQYFRETASIRLYGKREIMETLVISENGTSRFPLPFFRHISNDFFESKSIYNMGMGMKWKVLVDCKSAVYSNDCLP